jgi:hypothetical protein
MSPLKSKVVLLLVGLLMAAGPVAVAAGTASPAAAIGSSDVVAPSLPAPDLSNITLPNMPGLPGLGGKDSGNLKCAVFGLGLGPLYFLGPFGPLGPWGSMGPLHDKPHDECLGGGANFG